MKRKIRCGRFGKRAHASGVFFVLSLREKGTKWVLWETWLKPDKRAKVRRELQTSRLLEADLLTSLYRGLLKLLPI